MTKKDDEKLGNKSEQLTIRMHPPIYNEFKEWCHEHYQSMAVFTYWLIKNHLAKEKVKK